MERGHPEERSWRRRISSWGDYDPSPPLRFGSEFHTSDITWLSSGIRQGILMSHQDRGVGPAIQTLRVEGIRNVVILQ